MELLYAALLLHRAGKPIDEAGLTNVAKAAGIAVDAAKVKALVAALSDVNIEEVIKEAAKAPVAVAASGEAKAEKKEEKKEEPKAEESAAGLGALFG